MQVIMDSEILALKGPNQIFHEWKGYLQFVQAYFMKCGIWHPVVVEIGVQMGRQKAHYEKFLDAIHIGIDISNKYGTPDILGDSHDPETVKKLREKLGGRPINLLFLDAMHTYADTLQDYETYGPMTSDIIAFHDIRHEAEIGRLWRDILIAGKGEKGLSFYTVGANGNGWCELGIGLIVKKGKDELKALTEKYRGKGELQSQTQV